MKIDEILDPNEVYKGDIKKEPNGTESCKTKKREKKDYPGFIQLKTGYFSSTQNISIYCRRIKRYIFYIYLTLNELKFS